MLEHWEEVVEASKEAIRIRRDYADAYGVLGGAYLKLVRWEQAIEALKELTRIKPDHAHAHHSLGVAYLARGDVQAAFAGVRSLIEA